MKLLVSQLNLFTLSDMLCGEQKHEVCDPAQGGTGAGNDDTCLPAGRLAIQRATYILSFMSCFHLSLASLAIKAYLRTLLHITDTAGCKPVVLRKTFADSETTTSLPAPSAA